MRILHLIQRYYPYVGGSELYMGELSERLARAGHHVEVWTTDAWDLDYFWSGKARRIQTPAEKRKGVIIKRFRVRRLPLPSIYYRAIRRGMAEVNDYLPARTAILHALSRYSPWVPDMAKALKNLPSGAFDVVHSANISLESFIRAGSDYAVTAKIPHVVTPFTHIGVGDDRSVSRYYTMRHQIELLKGASRVIVQTRIERDFLAEKGVPIRLLERIGVGINPYEVAGGSAERFREKYGVEGPIVYYIGAAAHDKGTAHTIEAIRRLWSRGVRATFLMAGSTMLSSFKKYYEALPPDIKEGCRWLGYISDEDKRDLQAAGNVFCMPSRTESFGIVYLEAWLNGVPVIGARAGGVPEVVNDGIDGYLVEFGDVPAIANRIQLLLERPELATVMADRGRLKTLAEHTWDHKIGRIADIYQSIVK